MQSSNNFFTIMLSLNQVTNTQTEKKKFKKRLFVAEH